MPSKRYFRLDVSYDWAYRSPTADADVAALVGREPEGSGAGFGRRDLEFYFDSLAEVVVARRRLQNGPRLFPMTWTHTWFTRHPEAR